MLAISANNINEMFHIGMIYFRNNEQLIESAPRGQRRLQYRTPIASTYKYPRERVLFSPLRDANPFFHFMDALWLIAGRNDVQWLEQWLPSIKNYSDDGVVFHGAYGKRIRHDGQLNAVIERLKTEKDTTRAVLAIYDSYQDSRYTGLDLPCNIAIMFGITENNLNMTVANRSNDMIWGAYGANIVQFSMLQEYIAGHVGCDVGWYTQISNNAHIYPDNEVTKRIMTTYPPLEDPYHYDADPWVSPLPMFENLDTLEEWNKDLYLFIGVGGEAGFATQFFRDVASPMYNAHIAYRKKKWPIALAYAGEIAATDWRKACTDWLLRRQAKGT